MLQQSEPMMCPGLFYAVPARDGILSRLRTPGGMLTSQQAVLVAHFAAQCGDGYIQITNRANVQIRAVDAPPPASDVDNLASCRVGCSDGERRSSPQYHGESNGGH